MKHAIAALTLALALVACARQSEPGVTSTAAGPNSAQPATGAPSPPATSASANAGDISAAASTQQETRDSGSADSNEASLEKVAALAPEGQLPTGKWSAGTNYTVLSPAQPNDAPPGKVEVVEMFWYGCPHCYAFDPVLEAWRKHKAPYIEFKRVPVMWADIHRAHARLFYTLQALGKLDQLHSKVFDQIHQQGDELYVSGDPKATLEDEIKFAEANGVSRADFVAAYNSFGVQADLQQAEDLGGATRSTRYRPSSLTASTRATSAWPATRTSSSI